MAGECSPCQEYPLLVSVWVAGVPKVWEGWVLACSPCWISLLARSRTMSLHVGGRCSLRLPSYCLSVLPSPSRSPACWSVGFRETWPAASPWWSGCPPCAPAAARSHWGSCPTPTLLSLCCCPTAVPSPIWWIALAAAPATALQGSLGGGPSPLDNASCPSPAPPTTATRRAGWGGPSPSPCSSSGSPGSLLAMTG